MQKWGNFFHAECEPKPEDSDFDSKLIVQMNGKTFHNETGAGNKKRKSVRGNDAKLR